MIQAAFECQSKGEEAHVKLLSKASRALVAAELINAVPEPPLCPPIAVDGTKEALGCMIELLRYKTRTKPPATLDDAQYKQLLAILRTILQFAAVVETNTSAAKAARAWGKATKRYAQLELALTLAYRTYHTTERCIDSLSCKQVAQGLNLAIRALEYAGRKNDPVLRDCQSKLASGYSQELTTEERGLQYIPPELAAIKAAGVGATLAELFDTDSPAPVVVPSVFESSIRAPFAKNFSIQSLAKIFDNFEASTQL